MFAWQFSKALYTADLHGWTRFVSMQPHYNLIYREEEREMLRLCADQKIAVIPYSPVAKGLLTRKPNKERNETLRAQTDDVSKNMYKEEDLAIAQRVFDVADARGVPMAQVAIAWVLSNPVVTSPIIGATKTYHPDDAVAAVSIKLTLDELKHLEEAYRPHTVLGYA
jgi:aryl-alcohol dehydrogenase-like predicted oxidoreductase